MGLLRFTHRRPPQEVTPAEHPVVGQYRQLLATSSAERLLTVHRDAAALLDPFVRLVICNTARGVVGGDEPGAEQGEGDELVGDVTTALPQLVVAAASQDPSAFLSALDDGTRHRLAQAVAQVVTPADPAVRPSA